MDVAQSVREVGAAGRREVCPREIERGQLSDGGVYTLKVVAKDAADQGVGSQVLTRGRITGVELYDGQPYLTIGNAIVPLSTVIAVEEHTAAAQTPSALASLASSLNPLKMFS